MEDVSLHQKNSNYTKQTRFSRDGPDRRSPDAIPQKETEKSTTLQRLLTSGWHRGYEGRTGDGGVKERGEGRKRVVERGGRGQEWGEEEEIEINMFSVEKLPIHIEAQKQELSELHRAVMDHLPHLRAYFRYLSTPFPLVPSFLYLFTFSCTFPLFLVLFLNLFTSFVLIFLYSLLYQVLMPFVRGG